MTTAVLSTHLENTIIHHVLREIAFSTPGSSIYIALFTDATVQDDDNSGTEVSGGAYERMNVSGSGWSTPSSGSITNATKITYPKATGTWGNIRYVGIMDAKTSGSLLFHGQFNTDRTITEFDTFYISAEDLTLTVGGEMSTYLQNKILNHVFKDTEFSTPGSSIYVALYRTSQDEDDSGVETSLGVGYSRQNVTQWAVPSSGSTSNAEVVSMGTASGSWNDIISMGIRDDISAGNLLYFSDLTGSKVVNVGDSFIFDNGSITVTVN